MTAFTLDNLCLQRMTPSKSSELILLQTTILYSIHFPAFITIEKNMNSLLISKTNAQVLLQCFKKYMIGYSFLNISFSSG